MKNHLIDIIGYVALAINLFSMSTKGEYKLRLISLFANLLFIVYGFLIIATPVIVGGIIATCLHGYHLRRLGLKRNER